MGLDVPELDDTDYEELVEEARKLLPAYSEEWTNYNPQDPGVTVMEALAWLADSYIYQLDSVTDAHRRKYLGLMGERPRPPEVAATRVSLSAPADQRPLRVEPGTQLRVVDGSDAEKTFETDEAVVLTGATVAAVVGDRRDGRTDHSHANETAGMFYRPLGAVPAPGDAMALGVDGDPFDGADALSVTVDFRDEDLPDPGSHGEESTFDPSVSLVWEYATDYADPEGSWAAFEVRRDGTDHLYGGGTVTLDAPEAWDPADWGADEHGLYDRPAGTVWVRCRVERGGYEVPPRVDAVHLGEVRVSNRRTVEGEPLAPLRGTDGPEHLTAQRYRFEHAPVVEAEVSVDGERWTEVPDFDASGPTDRHYVLDAAAGTVRFGDGVGGAMPDPGARVVAERYVAADGADGNVPGSANWRFAEAAAAADGTPLEDVTVTPRGPAKGGSDAESVAAAFRRVRRDRKTPDRAVTSDDMAYLARETPGLRVGRAEVFLRDREGAPAGAPPEAQVVVVPYAPAGTRRPTPSAGFLEAVQTHLDEHRLLTDRVRAVGPTYVGIDVELTVRTDEWRPGPGVEDDVEAAIRAYLDPVHGFEGEGWPFGRTLSAAGIASVVAGVDAVDSVAALSVSAPGNARVDPDENVHIDEAALFALADVEVAVRAGSRPDDADGRGRGR
ncbi:MAG: putative baseplate assembly protein [Haloarculaceae archaeon]